MSDLSIEFSTLVGQPEGETLEYKAVLPPSRAIAQQLSSFANAKGGVLILGVSESPHGLEIKGLSEDFQANAMTHKAVDLLTPKPDIQYQYFQHQGKKLYGIKVAASTQEVALEGKVYKRAGADNVQTNAPIISFKLQSYSEINTLSNQLSIYKTKGTNAKHKLLDHYLSILKIIDDLPSLIYPVSPSTPTTNDEGKILSRILFSSFVDNFETYLSDLLFEIYLAKPQTLKSKQEVTVEEVLNCADMQEFVRYWAKQKLLKLQKGSVRGFVKENKQISDLKVLDKSMIEKVEAVLQVRHLFAHRNGIVDEKFIQYFPDCNLNTEYTVTVEDICKELGYLAEIVHKLDVEAVSKFDLAEL